MRAKSSVKARPVRDLTPNNAVVTTAAIMVTASHALPVSMSVMKYTKDLVNSASPESACPATSAYVRTRTATADNVHAAPAAAATASARANAGCSGASRSFSRDRDPPRFLGRMPTAKISPPTTVATDTLCTAFAMGRPHRTKAPGSETCRAAEAPEKIRAAVRTRNNTAKPANCHGREIPATESPPRGPGLGTGEGAVAELLADGTYPLSATRCRAANRKWRYVH